MTVRGWFLLLPAMFAIGCSATEGSTGGTSDAPVDEVMIGTDDLKEASPEDTSTAAVARGRDAIVDQARADQLVGEEESGYLGLVTDTRLTSGKSAPRDLEARVEELNAQRRALYADLAEKDGVSVDDVAHATACVLLRDKVKVGEAYRTEDIEWKVRVFDVPVAIPSFCVAK